MRHPLEPLSPQEVQQAVRLLRSHGKVTPTTRFVSVSLHEPPKDLVHGWAGQALPRQAFVVLFDNAR
jgi:primary-amine oxidase